jgi:predicted TIM-barrel fold metal-dependent hydrolase
MKSTTVLSFLLFVLLSTLGLQAQSPSDIKLKDYRPKSIYKIPISHIKKARFPVIDVHSHPAEWMGNPIGLSDTALSYWIKVMDEVGIEKTIIMTFYTGAKFDSIYAKYSAFGDRFELWCGIDFTGYNEKDWAHRAVKELERCHRVGAKGVGELADKGTGIGDFSNSPTPGYVLHIDDPRLKPLFQKCGELKMPVNIHVAEPFWMYQPMDSTNDGYMNAYKWRIDLSKKNLLTHAELINTLENVVRDNRKTTFIACHLANCEYDLEILGSLLRKYPNLYTDLGARYGEVAPIPKYMNSFCEKYSDRILYGTDMFYDPAMYATTFRILESNDEHFYEIALFGYHWPLYGFGLRNDVLKKIYYENAKKILMKK